ncbi:MAG: ribosome-associated translation inhibitor RaiA [Candidatus Sumerlaeia bacterium]|nr:ribosome-associated translation inhibitor RaiA [Candidatus Sumerlaeia bacterium]
MSLQITTRHIDVDHPTRERIEGKADKLRRYFDRIQQVDVILSQEKFQQIVEVVLHCDGVKVKAQEANEELLTALDRVFEKVERQIKKYKRRLIDGRRRGSARKTMNATVSVMRVPPEDDDKPEPGHHVIDVEERELLALTPGEAAMHLDLSGEPFLVFLNVENHGINVIYHRSDGHCGLIEPVVD